MEDRKVEELIKRINKLEKTVLNLVNLLEIDIKKVEDFQYEKSCHILHL